MKLENRDVLWQYLQVYYQEENALMRERTQLESIRRAAPLLAQVIHQGVAEGVFVSAYPDICAEIVLQMIGSMSRSAIQLYLVDGPDLATVESVQSVIDAYEEAVTRVLGAPAGSINVADVELYRRWFEE